MGKVARAQLCQKMAELRRFWSALSVLFDYRREPISVKLLASNPQSKGMQWEKFLASNAVRIRVQTVPIDGAGQGGAPV